MIPLCFIMKVLNVIMKPIILMLVTAIMALIAINNKMLFGQLLGVFNYSASDLRELIGWKGWSRVWRGWNRAAFFDGFLLDWFDGRFYTPEQIQMDRRAYQNFGGIFRIFLTVNLLIIIGRNSGVSAYRILKATLIRFMVASILGDIIFNTFFLRQPDINKSPQIKTTIDEIEKENEIIDSTEIKMTEMRPDLKIAKQNLKSLEKELKYIQRAANPTRKDKRKKRKFDYTPTEATNLIPTKQNEVSGAKTIFDNLTAKYDALDLDLNNSLTKLKSLNNSYKKQYYTIMVEERKMAPWVTKTFNLNKDTTDSSETDKLKPAQLTDAQARWYLDNHTDLKNVFVINGIYDLEAAKKHWQDYGYAEGRKWLALGDKPPILDDVQAKWYIDRYPDLQKVFFTDNGGQYNLDGAKNHWIVLGYEKKTGHTDWLKRHGRPEDLNTEQAKWYLDRYPDLKTAYGTDLKKARKHWKDYGYPGTSHQEWIEAPEEKVYNKKEMKFFQDVSLGAAYLLAGILNIIVYSMINSPDKWPMRIAMMAIATVLFIFVPFANLKNKYTEDLVELNNKRSVLIDFVNKIHPRALDKTASIVKLGLNYDPVQSLQMIVVSFILIMFVVHFIRSFTTKPTKLTNCVDGPASGTAEVTKAGDTPVVSVPRCTEDALAIRRRGHTYQSMTMRLFKGMEQPLQFEMGNIFIPIGAGILEGESAWKEARKTGITDQAILYDYKQKGFVYGYWRAIMIILFVTIIMKSEAFKSAVARGRAGAGAMMGGTGGRMSAMKAKMMARIR